jgi:hypothetical protein
MIANIIISTFFLLAGFYFHTQCMNRLIFSQTNKITHCIAYFCDTVLLIRLLCGSVAVLRFVLTKTPRMIIGPYIFWFSTGVLIARLIEALSVRKYNATICFPKGLDCVFTVFIGIVLLVLYGILRFLLIVHHKINSKLHIYRPEFIDLCFQGACFLVGLVFVGEMCRCLYVASSLISSTNKPSNPKQTLNMLLFFFITLLW